MTAGAVRPGTVALVGAGPGDPGLITVRGLQCVESADVVLYDRLVDRRLLGMARPSARLIDAGKTPGGGGSRQEEINRALVAEAREGRAVVRLKGGDPFVFGRGGEEAEALMAAGIPFEVVPGVTSAIAAPAYAGIPVTHRGASSSFTVVTGNEAPGKGTPAVDWDLLARLGGTLVVLMGWENLARIVHALTRAGYPQDTPAALVRWGTAPSQETVFGTVADIVGKGAAAGLAPPVVAVFGKVVDAAVHLKWLDSRPLFGKRVLVTRTRTQAGAMSGLLGRRGAEAIELPAIEIRPAQDSRPLDERLRNLSAYGWAVFASANAVRTLFDRLAELGLDARAFGVTRVAAVGPATAAALLERGIIADSVPEVYSADGVVEWLDRESFEGRAVLVPRADIGGAALERGLAEAGAKVDPVVAYHTVTPEGAALRAKRILDEGVDAAAFTSSSTVSNLLGLLDGRAEALARAVIACIGPATAATAGELGLTVDIVAGEHTVAGLVSSLEDYYAERVPRHE